MGLLLDTHHELRIAPQLSGVIVWGKEREVKSDG